MVNKHTPGPWQVQIKRDKDGVTSYSILTHIETAISVRKSDYWAEDYEPMTDEFGYYQPDQYMDCDTLKVANAHLIAAAPDLLEVLESMIEGAEAMGWDSAIKARAAIAKAKGETK